MSQKKVRRLFEKLRELQGEYVELVYRNGKRSKGWFNYLDEHDRSVEIDSMKLEGDHFSGFVAPSYTVRLADLGYIQASDGRKISALPLRG